MRTTMNNQRGFSLIEMMVSITLGLILLAGVLSIFLSSKVTYLANEKTSRLQENGRVALDFLTHDLRSSGYMGCAREVPFASTLNNPNSLLWNFQIPMQGFESDGAGAYAPALPGGVLNPAPVVDSDVLVIRSMERDGRVARVTGTLPPTGNIPVAGATLPVGSVAMISDCRASTVFQITGSGGGVITHAAGGSNPGNASNNRGRTFQINARISPLQTYIYYVANDPLNNNEPSLYRQTGSAVAEVLIDGVEALQIAYGEDTNNDRVADRYVPANAVGNWDRVMSATLSMLIRSQANGTTQDTNNYQVLPAASGGRLLGPFNDLRSRMVFNTTITIRNRAL